MRGAELKRCRKLLVEEEEGQGKKEGEGRVVVMENGVNKGKRRKGQRTSSEMCEKDRGEG